MSKVIQTRSPKKIQMKTGFHNNVEHPNCIQQIIITGSHDEKEISKLDFLTVSKFKLIHILVKTS